MMEEAPSFRGSRMNGGCLELFVGRTLCVAYRIPATRKKVSTLRPSADTQGRVRPRGVMCRATTLLEALPRNSAGAVAHSAADLATSGLGGGDGVSIFASSLSLKNKYYKFPRNQSKTVERNPFAEGLEGSRNQPHLVSWLGGA